MVYVWLAWCFVLLSASTHASETTLRLAVASNFKPAMEELAESFKTKTDISVSVSYGSSGKLYAQILHGAPFQVFLSADMERPQKLAQHLGNSNQPFAYAWGKLVVVKREQPVIASDFGHPQNLSSGHPPIFDEIENSGDYIAIANPVIAPYGLAAKQTLLEAGLWDNLSTRLVRGENVQHAFQFVQTGHAEYGFVAHSTLIGLDTHAGLLVFEVPKSFYADIRQGALLVERSRQSTAFVEFLRSEEAVSIIESKGYGVVTP